MWWWWRTEEKPPGRKGFGGGVGNQGENKAVRVSHDTKTANHMNTRKK